MPRVSVIIPAFNSEAVLPEALRSVLSQTAEDWEVVVADDASTDGTASVAEGFDERVKVVRSADNLGPAGARNLAIAAAGGELLAFLDADDRWLPEYLQAQISAYERAQQQGGAIGIVACDALIEGADGILHGTYGDRVPFPEPLTTARLLISNPIYVSALVPHRVIDRVGPLATDCFGTEDHDLWLRIVELGYRVVHNDQPLAIYRLAESSVSADPVGMSRNAQIVYERALERGNLSRRETLIARRELRLHRLIVELAEVRRDWGSGERGAAGRAVRAAPSVAAVMIENPHRLGRAARRMFGSGGVSETLAPTRDSTLR